MPKPKLVLLKQGGTVVGRDDAPADEEWIEEIPVSELPPNEWQRELDSIAELQQKEQQDRLASLEAQDEGELA